MKLKIISAVMVLAMLACIVPVSLQQPAVTPEDNLRATITAQAATIQAQNAPAYTAAPTLPEAVTGTPMVTETPTNTPLPTETATITFTPTSTVPMVTVSMDTNCRDGPGQQYTMTGALLVGQSAEVTGVYDKGGYWIIKSPGSSGTCWLWGQYATVTGVTDNLTKYPAPPTPTPVLPEAPKALQIQKTCTDKAGGGVPPGTLYSAVFTLTWKDVASNEDGYRVLTNGSHGVILPANSETIVKNYFQIDANHVVTFSVEAFNSNGYSEKKEKSVSCP